MLQHRLEQFPVILYNLHTLQEGAAAVLRWVASEQSIRLSWLLTCLIWLHLPHLTLTLCAFANVSRNSKTSSTPTYT